MIVVPLSTIVLLQGKLFKSSESCFVSPVWPDLANIYYIIIIYYILYRYCQCEVCLVISHLTSAQHYSPPTTKAWHSWLPDTIIISNINHFVRVLQCYKYEKLTLSLSPSHWANGYQFANDVWHVRWEVGGRDQNITISLCPSLVVMVVMVIQSLSYFSSLLLRPSLGVTIYEMREIRITTLVNTGRTLQTNKVFFLIKIYNLFIPFLLGPVQQLHFTLYFKVGRKVCWN